MYKKRKDPDRVVIPLPKDLLQEIDEFRWASRIPSRAEAIRLLVKEALEARKARP